MPHTSRVCLISPSAGLHHRQTGKLPSHYAHEHVSSSKAKELVACGLAVWTSADHLAITTDGREWKPTNSAGYLVLQLV